MKVIGAFFKILPIYIFLIYLIVGTYYGFHYFSEIHRRETCSLLSPNFKFFITCMAQPWNTFETIEPEIFLEKKLGVYSDEKFL